MNEQQLKNIVEGALLAAGRSLNLDDLQALFEESQRPDKGALKKAIDGLREDYAERGIEIKETASGFRVQVKQQFAEWISRLWEERPTRYSRALLETLALVAYRQPITRAEIEDVRGVSVSTSIIRTLQERDWIRVVGHRDVPGRPAMYGTTRTFLDYFGLKSLDELPTLAELRDIDSINVELDLQESGRDNNAPAADRQESGDGNDEGEGVPVEVALADDEPAEYDTRSEAEETVTTVDETAEESAAAGEIADENPEPESDGNEATDVPEEESTAEDADRHTS